MHKASQFCEAFFFGTTGMMQVQRVPVPGLPGMRIDNTERQAIIAYCELKEEGIQR